MLTFNAVLEEETPYHPVGLPAGGMPSQAAEQVGLALAAKPTLEEVLAPRRSQMAVMRRVVEGLTKTELDRVCGRNQATPYPTRSTWCAAASGSC